MARRRDRCAGQRQKFHESLIRDLVAYARYQFFWGGKQSDGASTQEHVDKAKQNCLASQVITDQTFAEAPPEVDCPYELEHVWDWFLQLDRTRDCGMALRAITFSEIRDWAFLKKIVLDPFEVEALEAVDRAFVIHHNSKSKEKSP